MDYRYIDESGRQVGPVPEGAIRALYKAGLIKVTTPIAEAESDHWEPYKFVFGVSDGPLPPPYAAPESLPAFTKRSAPKPERREVAGESRASFWWWVLAGIVVVAVAAVGVTAKRPSLLLTSAPTLKASEAPSAIVTSPAPVEKTPPPGLIATAIAAVSKGTSSHPLEKPKAPEKIDPLAEWYDFGFHQGQEARMVFGFLDKKLEPDKAQLVRLLENMEYDALKVSQENMQACFEGYKDGCLDIKPARLVSMTQRKSTLPEKLRGYQKFPDDKKPVASSNGEALDHALACTVMIRAGDTQHELGAGSGFFIGPGVLVTNRHVVENCQVFDVRMPDKSVVQGKVMAVSDTMDLALMSIPVTNNPILRIAASTTVHVGDHVTAVGFPGAYDLAGKSGVDFEQAMKEMDASTSFGQISAIDRKYRAMDCFQIDLTINHGNSGGPMIDEEGRVIGVNTFALAEGFERMNFSLKMTPAMAFIRANCGFNVELED